MKYKLYIAKYIGYDSRKNHFLFDVNGHTQTFLSYELNWAAGKLISMSELVRYMNERINANFKILAYYIDYGYYIERVKTVSGNYIYIMYDGATDERLEQTYKDLNDIPSSFIGKPVYRYRKKTILYEITNLK